MQLINGKNKFLQIFKIFLASLIIASSCLTSMSQVANAKEESYNKGGHDLTGSGSKTTSLTGGHTYSDLYASIMFSGSNNTVASSTLSFEDMKKYPSSSQGKGPSEATYGQLVNTSSVDKRQEAGVQLSNVIQTLYGYDYLVPTNKNSDNDGVVSTFLKAVFKSDEKSKNSITIKTALNLASVGAMTYDTFFSVIDWFDKIAVNLNIPSMFKLMGTNGEGKSHNFFNDLVSTVLQTMGLDGKAVKAFQYFTYIMILIIFSVTLIWAMRTSRLKGEATSILKRRGLNVLVIIMTIPVTLMLHGVMDEISSSFDNKVQAQPNQFNQHYVVDSLLYASTLNFNLGAINPGASIPTSDVGKMEAFKPTSSRINNLMQEVNTRANDAGLTESHETNARGLLSKIANQESVTVDSYLSNISVREGTSSIAASHLPRLKGVTISKSGEDAGFSSNQSSESLYIDDDAKDPMFFYENSSSTDKEMKVFEKAITGNYNSKGSNNYQYRNKGGGGNNRYAVGTTGGNEGTGADNKAREKAIKENGYPIKWVRVTHNVWPFAENARYNYVNIKSSSPQGYIYGATLPGDANKSVSDKNNFIDGPGGNQKVDFVTGKPLSSKSISEMSKEGGKDKEGKDGDSSASDKKAFAYDAKANSLRIALMNRYGGITGLPGSNIKSLSTQSTTFLLQSARDGKNAIKMDSKNSVPTEEGSTKNSGKDGISFVRYTIPNDGEVDLFMKAASLNTVWLISAITAGVSFLYLLRAPLLGSIAKQFTGFLSALFLGRLHGLLTYCIYYLALRASFITVKAAVVSGSFVATQIVGKMGALGEVIGTASALGFATGPASTVTIIIFAIILALGLIWPIATLSIGGKSKAVSFIGIIVLTPHLIANALEEWSLQLHRRIYGSGGAFSNSLRRNSSMINQKEMVGGAAKKAGKATAGLATAAGTGGLSLGGLGLGMAAKAGLNGTMRRMSSPAEMPGTTISDFAKGLPGTKDANDVSKGKANNLIPFAKGEDGEDGQYNSDDPNRDENGNLIAPIPGNNDKNAEDQNRPEDDRAKQEDQMYVHNNENDMHENEKDVDRIDNNEDSKSENGEGNDDKNVVVAKDDNSTHNEEKDPSRAEQSVDNGNNEANKSDEENSEQNDDKSEQEVHVANDNDGTHDKLSKDVDDISKSESQETKVDNDGDAKVDNNGETEVNRDQEVNVNAEDLNVREGNLKGIDEIKDPQKAEIDNAETNKEEVDKSETGEDEVDNQRIKDQEINKSATNQSQDEIKEVKDQTTAEEEVNRTNTNEENINRTNTEEENIGKSQADDETVSQAQTDEEEIKRGRADEQQVKSEETTNQNVKDNNVKDSSTVGGNEPLAPPKGQDSSKVSIDGTPEISVKDGDTMRPNYEALTSIPLGKYGIDRQMRVNDNFKTDNPKVEAKLNNLEQLVKRERGQMKEKVNNYQSTVKEYHQAKTDYQQQPSAVNKERMQKLAIDAKDLQSQVVTHQKVIEEHKIKSENIKNIDNIKNSFKDAGRSARDLASIPKDIFLGNNPSNRMATDKNKFAPKSGAFNSDSRREERARALEERSDRRIESRMNEDRETQRKMLKSIEELNRHQRNNNNN